MDSYSISHTTSSRRASSRIYQDLVAFRKLNTPFLDATVNELIMNTTPKVRPLFELHPRSSISPQNPPNRTHSSLDSTTETCTDSEDFSDWSWSLRSQMR